VMMRALLLVCLLATLALALKVPTSRPVLNDGIIETVNKGESSWNAGRNAYFEGMSVRDASRLMGTKIRPLPKNRHIKAATPSPVPATFDARQQWPKCQTLQTITDQARCGSCWAFACVEALSDRTCIFSNGSFNSFLSFQDLVTCDHTDDGCEGGEPFNAWTYAATSGLVTAACSPYTVPTCPPQSEPCLNFVPTPACVKNCESNYTGTWATDLHYSQKPYSVPANSIASEIYTNGPVEAAFTVYEDFIHYQSGVYVHKTGGVLGGHAVKLIGWGTYVNGTTSLPYWLVANSWTTTWGDQGYFMILRGKDECGIESGVVAGLPKLP